MRPRYYILKDGEPQPVSDPLQWAGWFECEYETARRVGYDVARDGSVVSTVFLGMDHAYGDGPPLVFETMTFDHRPEKSCDKYMWRYSTLDKAEAGHAAIVAAIRDGTELPE